MRRHVDKAPLDHFRITIEAPSPKTPFCGFSRRRDGGRSRYEVLSDTEVQQGQFRPELIKFTRRQEKYIEGFEFMRRFRESEMPGGGKLAVKAMFKVRHEIPDFFQGHVLWFPATVFTFKGLEFIAYMHYGRRGWTSNMGWLKYCLFFQGHRMVILCD